MSEALLWPLRADATRRELLATLEPVAGVRNVETAVVDGSIEAIVELSPSADDAAVKAILDRYAIAWTAVVAS